MQKARPHPPRPASSDLQRAKSEQTRSRVLEAAIQLIAEGGFHRATSKRLAEESGMSWGAIQYQFGSKASIFEALLDQALSEFGVGLEDGRPIAPETPLEVRIHALVNGARRLIEQPIYVAFRQILHDTQLLDDLGMKPADLLSQMHRTISAQIGNLIGIDSRSKRQLDLFQATLFATTRGIEEQARLDAFPAWITKRQFERLESQLIDLVEGDFEKSRTANPSRKGKRK